MVAVAVPMVLHTLVYRSQVVTGLAFLLAFITVTLNRADVYSLLAGAILAVGVSVTALRMRWYHLEVFGILATYLNHFYWLRPIIEPMEVRQEFPAYKISVAILVLYWLVFRVSYILRRPEAGEAVSTVAGLLNPGLLLAVLKYQSVRPELAFWFLLGLGATELGLGQLPVARRRRAAFVVLSALGATLLFAAVPFRFSAFNVALLWLAEAQTFLLAGIFTREVVFRRLALIAVPAIATELLAVNAARVLGTRMDGAYVAFHLSLGLVFGLAAVLWYGTAHWAPRRWPDLFQARWDQFLAQLVSCFAGAMVLAGAWVAFPEGWTILSWMAMALVLAGLGRRFQMEDVVLQANLLAACAVLRLLVVNLPSAETVPVGAFDISVRLITVAAAAALLYFHSRWSRTPRWELTRHLPPAFTWAASTAIVLLLWYELRSASVVLAWALFSVCLFELGIRRGQLHLRLQAYAGFVLAFGRTFFVNLNAEGVPGALDPRVYTILPLAVAFFYCHERLFASDAELLGVDRRMQAPELLAWLGTLTVAALLRFEIQLDWIAAAWATLGLGLAAVAWKTRRRVFLHQGIFLGMAVFFRASLHGLYERSYFHPPWWYSPLLTVGTCVALLLLTLFFAFRLRNLTPDPSEAPLAMRMVRALGRRPEQAFFFLALALLTALLGVEFEGGWTTVAWGLEAVAVFLLAIRVGERSFRLSGLGLLLLCVGKILTVDFWLLALREKAITFIALGVALVTVSVFYTRHRELIRRYL